MIETPYRRQEITTRERALAQAQAAEEVGGVAVRILANESEPYTHKSGLRGRRMVYHGSVPEGHVYLGVESNGSLSEHSNVTQQIIEGSKKVP